MNLTLSNLLLNGMTNTPFTSEVPSNENFTDSSPPQIPPQFLSPPQPPPPPSPIAIFNQSIRNLCNILELNPTSCRTDFDLVYRKLDRYHHPDKWDRSKSFSKTKVEENLQRCQTYSKN